MFDCDLKSGGCSDLMKQGKHLRKYGRHELAQRVDELMFENERKIIRDNWERDKAANAVAEAARLKQEYADKLAAEQAARERREHEEWERTRKRTITWPTAENAHPAGRSGKPALGQKIDPWSYVMPSGLPGLAVQNFGTHHGRAGFGQMNRDLGHNQTMYTIRHGLARAEQQERLKPHSGWRAAAGDEAKAQRLARHQYAQLEDRAARAHSGMKGSTTATVMMRHSSEAQVASLRAIGRWSQRMGQAPPDMDVFCGEQDEPPRYDGRY
jgi:hypothetical protein